MRKVCLFIAVLFAVLCNSNATAETNDVNITIAQNPWLDASFVRKVKTKREGWLIYVRFTNKTAKPIYGVRPGTNYAKVRGEWVQIAFRSEVPP